MCTRLAVATNSINGNTNLFDRLNQEHKERWIISARGASTKSRTVEQHSTQCKLKVNLNKEYSVAMRISYKNRKVN